MDAETKLYDILNSEETPAYYFDSFLDVDNVPDNFYIFQNITTYNMRADNKIIYETLVYDIYYYAVSPGGLRTIVKSKIKELEENGIKCGAISNIGKIDRRFGLTFTVYITQKF